MNEFRKALITGASSGIGAEYARQLAAAGCDLVLVARRAERLAALADDLRAAHGVHAECIVADLAEPEDLCRACDRIALDESIDLVVNNAGVAGLPSVLEADAERVAALLQLNVMAMTQVAIAAAQGMRGRPSPALVNIGSVTALMPERFEPCYLASKAYVLSFSEALALQLAPHGIRVQVVLPGVTQTEMWGESGLQAMPATMIMQVADLVSAALAGLALGETVTIPSLPSTHGWDAYVAARQALAPNLSLQRPAARYLA